MGREQPKRRHRLRLPLQHERLDRLRVHRALHELVRRLSDQHLARRRRLLEPRRHVHRIPGHQPLRRARHHLTGVHADPALNAERRQRIAHLDRRPTGAERVVLMHLRHPEHRHHRVTDELLHRPAVRLDDPAHPLEVAAQQGPQRLRVSLLAKRRRADQVTEQHRHRLAHLTGRRTSNERRSTRHAEPRLVGVLVTATRADQHQPRLEHPQTNSYTQHHSPGASVLPPRARSRRANTITCDSVSCRPAPRRRTMAAGRHPKNCWSGMSLYFPHSRHFL